jgi:hypothetical protein
MHHKILMSNKNLSYLFLLSLIITLPFHGCGQGKKGAKKSDEILWSIEGNEWNKSIPGSFSPQTKSKFDSLEISSFLGQYPRFKKFEENINTFYSHRKMPLPGLMIKA